MRQQLTTLRVKSLLCRTLVAGTIFCGRSHAQVPPVPQQPVENSEQAASTKSAPEYMQRLVKQEKGTIDSVLQRQVNLKTTTYADIAKRWKAVPQQLVEAGATAQQAKEIAQSARNSVTTERYGMPYRHWPIFAKRGVVNGESMWVIVLAWPKSDPSSDKSDGYKWYRQVILVHSHNLSRVTYTSNLHLQEQP